MNFLVIVFGMLMARKTYVKYLYSFSNLSEKLDLILAQLYYHFINPQGFTSKNAEANIMMRLPTCNQQNQEQLLGF